MNGLPDGSGSERNGRGYGRVAAVELPPRATADAGHRPVDPAPRLVAPRKAPVALPRLALRILIGSVGLALAVGIGVGRLTATEKVTVASTHGPAEIRIRGAGHLDTLSGEEALGMPGLLADARTIRDRFLATGVPKDVSVERLLPAGVLVEVEEKRAVALLDEEPPRALAADGTVLGAATAADFTWAGVTDLVLVRSVPPADTDFEARAALAGRLGEALRTRPDLDRLVSELDVREGPFRLRLVLRSSARTVLLTEEDFLKSLELVARLLPDLVVRWPGLTRIDARVPDRLLVRSDPPEIPAQFGGGQTQ